MSSPQSFRESTFNVKTLMVIYLIFAMGYIVVAHFPPQVVLLVIILVLIPFYFASLMVIIVDDKSLLIKVHRGIIRRRILLADIRELIVSTESCPILTPFDVMRSLNIVITRRKGLCYGIDSWNPQLILILTNDKRLTIYTKDPDSLARAILLHSDRKMNLTFLGRIDDRSRSR